MDNDTPFTKDGAVPELGEDQGEHALHGLSDCRDAALALMQAARRGVRIFSHDLDAEVLGTDAFVDAASAMARRNAYTFIRILLQDPQPALRRAHPLIQLVQALPSHIEVRRTAEEWAGESFAFVVADHHGLLYRPIAERYEGSVDFAAGATAVQYRTWFDEVWEHSTPEAEFRPLGI